jgi:hypothetical protein
MQHSARSLYKSEATARRLVERHVSCKITVCVKPAARTFSGEVVRHDRLFVGLPYLGSDV